MNNKNRLLEYASDCEHGCRWMQIVRHARAPRWSVSMISLDFMRVAEKEKLSSKLSSFRGLNSSYGAFVGDHWEQWSQYIYIYIQKYVHTNVVLAIFGASQSNPWRSDLLKVLPTSFAWRSRIIYSICRCVAVIGYPWKPIIVTPSTGRLQQIA